MNERGSVTVWMLGLGMTLIMLGGISTELWRVLGERRLLAATADAASIAGASGIDLDIYRASLALDPADPRVVLDEDVATARALLAVELSGIDLAAPPDVAFSNGSRVIEVTLESHVDFLLLRLLRGTAEDIGRSYFVVTATASSTATEFE